MLHPKNVGALPVEGRDEHKQTNEIGLFIPTLENLDITGKTLTGDALLTQRKRARYRLEERAAYYVFMAKEHPLTLLEAIRLLFEDRGVADYQEPYSLAHGRPESRSIWISTKLND